MILEFLYSVAEPVENILPYSLANFFIFRDLAAQLGASSEVFQMLLTFAGQRLLEIVFFVIRSAKQCLE